MGVYFCPKLVAEDFKDFAGNDYVLVFNPGNGHPDATFVLDTSTFGEARYQTPEAHTGLDTFGEWFAGLLSANSPDGTWSWEIIEVNGVVRGHLVPDYAMHTVAAFRLGSGVGNTFPGSLIGLVDGEDFTFSGDLTMARCPFGIWGTERGRLVLREEVYEVSAAKSQQSGGHVVMSPARYEWAWQFNGLQGPELFEWFTQFDALSQHLPSPVNDKYLALSTLLPLGDRPWRYYTSGTYYNVQVTDTTFLGKLSDAVTWGTETPPVASSVKWTGVEGT